MPAVRAVGITTGGPPPFQLPVLDNRGDVAARLAAIESMITDDAGGGSLAGGAARSPESTARANADARANRPPRDQETVSRVRAAATVPAHARLLRPDGAPAAAPVSYAADDWRGHIKGVPARADAQLYGGLGGLGGPASTRPEPTSSAPASVPTTRAGDVTTQAADAAKPISMLDRVARIGLLGGLLAIFVLLFIFGPKISQWWGKL